jgi:hypothetical protein
MARVMGGAVMRWMVALVVCVIASAFNEDAAAQINIDTLGHGVAWQLFFSPGSASTVTGTVFETSGRPVAQALVLLRATNFATLTDSLGRFQITPGNAGRFELEIASIGYLSTMGSILLPPDYSAFVTVVLRERGPRLCGLVAGSPYRRTHDLNIEVVDSLSGEPPAGPVTLRLVQGDSIREHTRTLHGENPGGRVIGPGLSIRTFGRHDIEIRAAGYEVWRREGVDLWLMDDCYPQPSNNSYVARLVPRRP